VSRRVAGKLIVVTGGARGQGAAEARRLAAEGADVVAADLAGHERTDVDAARIHPRDLDVTQPGEWKALAAWIDERFGRVDGLINNAGTTSRVRLPDIDVEEWNRTLAVNLTGPMLGITTLLPLMPAGASIVNVGSIAGLTAHYTAAYTASKWGLRGLTQTAAMELGPRRIRVNAVHPGYIHTPMTASAPRAFLDANVAITPLGRGGEPEEVADLMVFLMSDESRFITGAEIPIDGGQTGGGIAKFLSDAVRGGAASPESPDQRGAT
jgi:3alpha(or 20beta)-hydroxysteroid dehydrogenase